MRHNVYNFKLHSMQIIKTKFYYLVNYIKQNVNIPCYSK